MGLRFDLGVANWIAFVIDDSGDVPDFPALFSGSVDQTNRMALESFLHHLRHGLMSSPSGEQDLAERVDRALKNLWSEQLTIGQMLESVREYFRSRKARVVRRTILRAYPRYDI